MDHLRITESNVQTIEEGELSQAYFYDTPEGKQVLRINDALKN